MCSGSTFIAPLDRHLLLNTNFNPAHAQNELVEPTNHALIHNAIIYIKKKHDVELPLTLILSNNKTSADIFLSKIFVKIYQYIF